MTKKAKKRRIRPVVPIGRQTQTVREKAQESVRAKKQPKRRVRTAVKTAVKPFRFLRFLRILVPPFFRRSWQELRQVTWPSRKETWQLTLAVFVFAIAFSLAVAIVDYGLDKIFRRILLKL